MNEDERPDPEGLLSDLKEAEAAASRAKLKIFFGMSAGVGKTYAMLQEARVARAQGLDIAIGAIETHDRPDTEALLAGLEVMPLRAVDYRGARLQELDLDALIARRPAIAIIDELAHTNAPGSRHLKRWQDVIEILDRGISVWTAVNVQHMESFADVVEDITGARVRERVPDIVFDRADEVRLIDVAPEDLIRRLKEGAVYTAGAAESALANFFKPKNLGALREIALRFSARMAGRRLAAYARAEGGDAPRASLGDRLLVAVGPSPNSAYLVRWTRRTAYSLRADWTALHVDSGQAMTEEDRKRLEDNLALARKLGAETLVVPATDIAGAVMDTARRSGATMIVVGRSGLSRLGPWPRRATVPDRIVREASPIDVAVVQDNAGLERPAPGKGRAFATRGSQYAILALAFAAVTALGELLSPSLSYRGISLVYLAVVLGFSFFTSPGPVAVFAVVSALSLNFLFIPPLYTFSIGTAEDVILFAVYFLVAFVTSTLVSRIRSRERLLRDRERASSFLLATAQRMSECSSVEEAAETAARLVQEQFETEAAVFADDGLGALDPRPRGSAAPRIDEREFDVAAYAYAARAVCGARSDTLSTAALRYVPALAGEAALGVIGLVPPEGKAWARADENLVESLGRIFALIVGRLHSEARSRRSALALESERLGGILLDSVSHELRTPLTTITGSLSALRDDALAESPEPRRAILSNALEAADRLDGVVEDLLGLSRIESGMLTLNRRAVDLQDLARSAMERAGPELQSREVALDSEPDSPAIIDPALGARLAANLLRNAARYSPPGARIDFSLKVAAGTLAIKVRDRGPGLRETAIAGLFAKFKRGDDASGPGLGLGLAICKGIAEAHGGSIIARNAPGGGLEVEALLPSGPREERT